VTNTQHPDFLTNQTAVKAITRGGRQAADDQAMEAMWQAIERGASKEEAETIFSNTYRNIICTSKKISAVS
jgi:hypothetical protein